MNINEVYELVLYCVAKNLQDGYVSPDDFNRTINQAQKSYSAYLLGVFNTYIPGRPVSKVELGQNSVVRQRLSPTIYGFILNPDTTGFSPYPADYLQTDSMWSLYGFDRIRYVQQDSLWSFYNSVIDPIATNPIYLIEDTGFRFYPQSIGQTRLSYVRNPPEIRWGYTLDVNGMPVYNPLTSIDPVWDDASIWEIVIRALAMIGVNLQLGVVMQYSNEIKNAGQ